MLVALHSILAPGAEADYDREHRRIPEALVESFARVGIHDWMIWRSGRDLFHVVHCDDWVAAMNGLAGDPADAAWQAHIGVYVERFIGDRPEDRPLPQIWSLHDQLDENLG